MISEISQQIFNVHFYKTKKYFKISEYAFFYTLLWQTVHFSLKTVCTCSYLQFSLLSLQSTPLVIIDSTTWIKTVLHCHYINYYVLHIFNITYSISSYLVLDRMAKTSLGKLLFSTRLILLFRIMCFGEKSRLLNYETHKQHFLHQ